MSAPIPRMKDVAARAGVAPSTVSNVLNHPELVAPETRARVERVILELGFVPNASARQLRRGHGQVLGLVVLDLGNPFFSDVAYGVDAVARQAGLAVILCNSDRDSGREATYLDLLAEHRVRGVLITPVEEVVRQLRQLRERGIPVVLVDRVATRPDLCSVAVDDRLGGRRAVEHLLETGHRRIAFLGGPWRLRQVQDRYEGACVAMREVGLAGQLRRLTAPGPPTSPVDAGREAVARILGLPGPQRPTAVFCASDLVTLGVLQGLTQHGLRVPDDIALVGYDDIDFAAAAAVPLTSVRQPRQRLGRVAAELLLDEIEHPDTHQHRQVVFEPDLAVRDSTGRIQADLPRDRHNEEVLT